VTRLPSTSPWLRDLGVADPETYDPKAFWSSAPGGNRLVVPLGTRTAPVPAHAPRSRVRRILAPVRRTLFGVPLPPVAPSVTVDLSRHRIGVIQGWDGSGKERLLRSLLIGLCTRYGPDRVSLVLLDCLRTDTFTGIAGFPHVRQYSASVETDAAGFSAALSAVKREATRRRRLSPVNLSRQPRLVVALNGFTDFWAKEPKRFRPLEDAFAPGHDLGMTLLLCSTFTPPGLTPLIPAAGFAAVTGYASQNQAAPLLGPRSSALVQSRYRRAALRTGPLDQALAPETFVGFATDDAERSIIRGIADIEGT